MKQLLFIVKVFKGSKEGTLAQSGVVKDDM